jgi:integrase
VVKDPALWRLGPRFESWRGYTSTVGSELSVVDGGLVVSGKDNKQISLEDLPQDKIKDLIKRLSLIRKRKYTRCKERRYGNLNKGFTEGELQQFFKCCKNPRAYLAFKIMSLLGLRITECVSIKILDLDFQKNKIRIDTEKAGTIDYLYLHNEVRKLLFEWCEKFQEEILAHDGFILFPDPRGSSVNNHISANWLRKEFRNVCLLSNLNESYGMANNYIGKGKFKDRRLFRLTTHSLRHYYISKVYRASTDPIRTQKLARHQDFKSTQVYIHISQKEVDETLEKVFEQDNNEKLDKSDLKALLELARMLK